jgi:hypothetical protein
MRGRGKKENDLTQASLLTKVATLENKTRKYASEIAHVEKSLKQKSIQSEDKAFQIETLTTALKEEEARVSSLQRHINEGLYEKQRFMETEARTQRMLQRWDQMIVHGKKGDSIPTDVDEAVAHALADTQKIQRMIQTLQDAHPHLRDVLTRVAMLAEPL